MCGTLINYIIINYIIGFCLGCVRLIIYYTRTHCSKVPFILFLLILSINIMRYIVILLFFTTLAFLFMHIILLLIECSVLTLIKLFWKMIYIVYILLRNNILSHRIIKTFIVWDHKIFWLFFIIKFLIKCMKLLVFGRD